MKWNNRIVRTMAIGAAVGLVLTGCGAEEEPTAGEPGTDASSEVEIAFIPGVSGDEFYITMECGIQEAAEAAGATVNVQGPQQFDPTLQKPIIDSVVGSQPDILLVAPTDVTAMQAPLEAAAEAGTKVVLVDTTVEDPSFAVSRVASDNIGGGAAAFEAIKEQNPEGGQVLVVGLTPGISTTDARTEGFAEAAEAGSDFEYLGVEYSNNEPAQAAQIVTAALQANPGIVGIFAVNLFAAEGTATGVRQAGASEDVTVVGFDAGPAQVQQLEKGTVQALIAQEPRTIGQLGVEQGLAALNDEPVEEEIQTGFTIITRENLDGEEGDAVYQSSC